MAEFCKKCGAPLQGRRFCMNCGTMNEDADIAAQAGETTASSTSGTVTATAQIKKEPNWLLIGAVAVLCIVLGIVIALVSGQKDTAPEFDNPMVGDNANNNDSTAGGRNIGTSTWADVTEGFDETMLQDAVDLLFHSAQLISYGGLDYEADTSMLVVYDCCIELPEGCLLDFSDVRIDFRIDLSEEGVYKAGINGYHGTPRIDESGPYSIMDDYGHELEVYYQNDTFTTDDESLIIVDVCVIDLDRADAEGLSDPSYDRYMYMTPCHDDVNFYCSYVLYSVDEDYTIYLDENFCPIYCVRT